MKIISTLKKWQVGLHYEEIIKISVELICDYLKVQFIARDNQGKEVVLFEASRNYYVYYDIENFQVALEIIQRVTGQKFIETEIDAFKTILVREDFVL